MVRLPVFPGEGSSGKVRGEAGHGGYVPGTSRESKWGVKGLDMAGEFAAMYATLRERRARHDLRNGVAIDGLIDRRARREVAAVDSRRKVNVARQIQLTWTFASTT